MLLSIPFLCSKFTPLHIYPSQIQMDSTLHATFKPWATPQPKPPPLHKLLNSPNSSCSTHHDLPCSTLPLPKHALPARLPAKVCVLSSTGTWLASPSVPKFLPQL
ncbi:hypothetical protein D8B26_007181 [Coccidioides posadasii str. Silveira]|uniref:uncharacterized protein n=1 Tax=Coccidioides posadasii (strain RMSCC 757 / Silveira) TaxID=443226 RepID=UPI001BEFFE6C|nr:hypothetical protein D8B26_007181 [Coccidioides posadasii str. Silveira]